jgi:hypothetical protein
LPDVTAHAQAARPEAGLRGALAGAAPGRGRRHGAARLALEHGRAVLGAGAEGDAMSTDELDDLFLKQSDKNKLHAEWQKEDECRAIIAGWDIRTRAIIGHCLKKRDARMTASGFAAGVEQAAKVCDERALMHEHQNKTGDVVEFVSRFVANENRATAAAIRRLAAPPADGGTVAE